MNNSRHPVLRIIVVLMVGLTACTAWAQVDTVSVTANTSMIPDGAPATIVLRWRVTLDLATRPGPDTITSTEGVFWDDTEAQLPPNINTTLTGNTVVPVAPNIPPTVTITEVLQIPGSIIYQAAKKGGTLSYQRSFSDTANPLQSAAGTVVFQIGTASSGTLGISRIALRFDDQSIEKIAANNQLLHAVAEVNYSGSGLLRAVWEIAPVSRSRRAPQYRVLSRLHRYLTAGNRMLFESPTLPTSEEGLYWLRLRILEPTVGFEEKKITYRVQQQAGGLSPAPSQELMVTGPSSGITLSGQTEFSWQQIPLARVYQLEIYDRGREVNGLPGTPSISDSDWPVTGVMVPASRERLQLGHLPHSHLQPGGIYHWRVIAIGESGAIIAVSPTRQIHAPLAR